MAHPPPRGLTSAERREFDYIVDKARSAGWLTPAQSIEARRSNAAVLVRCARHGAVREKRYTDEDRWLYHFLHDLAHGYWR